MAFLIIIALHYHGPYHEIVTAAVILTSISLLIGFLTPYLCVMAAVFVIGNLIINPETGSVVCVIAIANAAALGLLGPGAYSLDAKLFGRHVTIVRFRNGDSRL
ncbi:MAG TPA: hypothetical protein VFI24_13815 [Pyrinomonadaceae bacterium]|nr:hypothetical protein [Pyrinomonadaceae bacterium]